MYNFNIMRNEKGYAFIEIVFLVAIIAILSSIVVPKISNEVQIAQADYLMKSLYSELRFMQAARRTSSYRKEAIFPSDKEMKPLILVNSNKNKRYRLMFADDEELRKYKLPSYFSFKSNFYMTVIDGSILSNNVLGGGYRGNIKIINNTTNKSYKPFLVFNTVGRIRFSNTDDDD